MLVVSNIHHQNGPLSVTKRGLAFEVYEGKNFEDRLAVFTAESEAPVHKAIALRKAMEEADRLAAEKGV